MLQDLIHKNAVAVVGGLYAVVDKFCSAKQVAVASYRKRGENKAGRSLFVD